MMKALRKYFLTGLILLLPAVLTLLIVRFVLDLLTKPFLGFVTAYLGQPTGILSKQGALCLISQLIIFLFLLAFICFLGLIGRIFFISTFLSFADRMLHKLPLINRVYKTVKEVVNQFLGEEKTTFKQVVMVPFPKKGIYVIGFLSEAAPSSCSVAAGDPLYSVFIPTTPNPTTGYLVMYKKEDIIMTKMLPEDAIKYIVSCGIVTPMEPKK